MPESLRRPTPLYLTEVDLGRIDLLMDKRGIKDQNELIRILLQEAVIKALAASRGGPPTAMMPDKPVGGVLANG